MTRIRYNRINFLQILHSGNGRHSSVLLTGAVPAAGLDAAPGDGEAARWCSSAPPCPPSYQLLRETLLLGHRLLREHTQTPPLQRAALTAALVAPCPSPAACWFLAQPAKLLRQLLLIQSWSMWASIAPCYWSQRLPDDELRKDHVELEGLEGRGAKAVPTEMVIRSWMISYSASTSETRIEERTGPWTLSWHPPATAQSLPRTEEVSLFPNTHKTKSGAKNPVLFIYFGFNACRPLTTRIFTTLLYFVWRCVLLSLV